VNASTRQTALLSKQASRRLATFSLGQRNRAIHAAADSVDQSRQQLLAANAEDLAQADGMLASREITQATYERLRLTHKKIDEMTQSMRAVAELPDPLCRVLQKTELDSGLVLEKATCPLGLLAVIFEARPDAVTQISALALKSGNAVILKPGAEVQKTSSALMKSLESLPDVPRGAIGMLQGRQAVKELLELNDLVDLVIPRGSKQLIEFVQANTKIPVLGHAEGICHVYVDAHADFAMALDIVDDAKTDYPAACNAAETVLVHDAIAERFLPKLSERLLAKSATLRGCEKTRTILGDDRVEPVAEDGWHHEYSDLVLAVRVVGSLDEAIRHIHDNGSSHTETIVTENAAAAEEFLARVDSAGVFHNASTRFADGFRYGFGAEVGISTSKLHARGPVGLEGLTTYKYVLRGSGQVARDYHGPNARPFTHKRLD
jgi:glutamate-5-semialdehyde dehydrogenase